LPCFAGSAACIISMASCYNGRAMGEYRLSVREWPESERPREKLAQGGPDVLSTAELLAIVLRTGTVREDVLTMSQRLLVRHGGISGLARCTLAELGAEHGLGLAKGAQLKAALELGKRLQMELGAARVQVRSPKDVADLLMYEMGVLQQEVMRTVLLNTKSRTDYIPNHRRTCSTRPFGVC